MGLETLIAMRDSTGIWMPEDIGWWNSANLLTAVLRYGELSGRIEELKPLVEDIYIKSRVIGDKGNFINEYYDDEGWWLLAWLDAYRLTEDARYLSAAKYIFEDMTTGWDEVCGGGIYWKKPQIYKNAIANNLFNLSAARLYHLTGEERYKR